MVEIHAVPAFRDNYIWVIAEGGRAAAVDPGESAPVERFLEAKRLELTDTLASSGFADAVEPGNRRLAERKAREAAKRARGEPTLPSTIGEELATNPFLRCRVPEVIASAERHAGRGLAGAVEVFAEIRAWKNNF